MYSSAQAQRERCLFRSELRRLWGESLCEEGVPVTCAGLGAALHFPPPTILRRVHRRMEGLALRIPGRPRDEQAPRQVRRLSQRLQQAQSAIEILRQQGRAHEQAAEEACQRLLLGLIFHGASLRSAAECLKLAFGDLAPAKTTVAQRLIALCGAAEKLFETHFAGRGKSGACDEIYLSGHPVLEVVEPRSLAITGICPDRAPSEEAWEQLLEIFAELESGASAQGLGVSAALAKKVARHALDLWHLLRHFSAAVGRLESRAYEWMQEQERRIAVFVAALPVAPGACPAPELTRLEECRGKCERAIRAYADASTVLGWLYEATRPSDLHGRVKTPEQIRDDWETALDLIDHIDAEALYALEKKLRGKMDGACALGLQERLNVVKLPAGWNEAEREGLQLLVCKAWRYHHHQQTHLLQAPRAAACTVAAQLGLPFTAPHLEAYAQTVFEILDRVWIASSAVECVNSIIRLRQGAKRHPHRGFVFLIAWLHNTRCFTEGRRKGLSPSQLLGVDLPSDGWSMLLQQAA